MKKAKFILMGAVAVSALSSCSKLGKLTADNFTVTPTPLEAVGGQVPATINGTFPVKYMKKKAVVTVIPVLKYEGGEVEGQSATFQGEKVEGNATTVNYKVGGTYTMTAEEAARLVNTSRPHTVIPTHYGCIVGSLDDARTFVRYLDRSIEVCLKID